MPARWAALLLCSVAVGAPPLAVEPPLVADFDEWEVWHRVRKIVERLASSTRFARRSTRRTASFRRKPESKSVFSAAGSMFLHTSPLVSNPGVMIK